MKSHKVTVYITNSDDAASNTTLDIKFYSGVAYGAYSTLDNSGILDKATSYS